MRKVFCVLLGILLIISGCSPHITAHCQDISIEIGTSPDMRENYHPTLTPIADVAGECYCHVEDAAITTVAVPVIVIVFLALIITGGDGAGLGELVGTGLDALIN